MFAYLPEIYPDELIYSWICRYHAHNGYPDDSRTLLDLLDILDQRITIEYSATFNKKVLERIDQKYGGIERLCQSHSMIECQTRYHPNEERQNYLSAVTNMQKIKLVRLEFGGGRRFLKFCPECAKEDRFVYGETFWHRKHQIDDLNACIRHNCMLCSTNIHMYKEKDVCISAAELCIPETPTTKIANTSSLNFAKSFEEQEEYANSGTYIAPSELLTSLIPAKYYVSKSRIVDYGFLTQKLNEFIYPICYAAIPQNFVEHVLNGNYIDSRIIHLMLYFFKYSPL